MYKKMVKLRISARPDGNGWIDYRHEGNNIGSSKPHYKYQFYPITKTVGLLRFIEKHNL